MGKKIDGGFCRRRLVDYLLLLPEDQKAQIIRNHLAACPACRAALGRFFLLDLWEEGCLSYPAGAELAGAVMARLAEDEAISRPSSTRIAKVKVFNTSLTLPSGSLSASEKGWPQAGGEVLTRENSRAKTWGWRIFWNYLAAGLVTAVLLFGGFFDAVTDLALRPGRLREGIGVIDRYTQQMVGKGLMIPQSRQVPLHLSD